MQSDVEYAESFAISRMFFYIIGLFPFPDVSIKWRFLTDCWFWLGYINLTICALLETITIVIGFATKPKNFVANLAIVPLVSYTIIGLEQILSVYRQRERIIRLVVALRELFMRHTAQDLARYNYETFKQRGRKLQVSYAISYITLIMTFNFISIGRSIVNFFVENYWFLELPYAVWYPFNVRDNRVFLIAYMQQLIWGFTCIIGVLAINLLLSTLTDQLCFAFYALGTDMRALVLRRESGKENVARISRMVQQHNAIIELAQEFGEIISFTLLMNFLLISVVMCTVGFQVIATESVSESLKFLLFLMVCLLQTLSLSYFGNCIIDAVSILLLLWTRARKSGRGGGVDGRSSNRLKARNSYLKSFTHGLNEGMEFVPEIKLFDEIVCKIIFLRQHFLTLVLFLHFLCTYMHLWTEQEHRRLHLRE